MRIAYGLAGEGRGHCTRAVSLGEALIADGHEVMYWTDADARELLEEHFGQGSVQKMPVPRLQNTPWGVSYFLSGVKFTFHFIPKVLFQAKKIGQTLDSFNPDIVISDFEPILPRLARRRKLPLIEFSSQQFLRVIKTQGFLSLRDRIKGISIGATARFFCPKPTITIVSKPFTKLKTKHSDALLVGPMIRQSLRGRTWEPNGTHITGYFRGKSSKAIHAAAEFSKQQHKEFRIYGVHGVVQGSHVTERPISEATFIEDMATSDMVICTAGSQIIGEIAHLGVPAILVPEPGQDEQRIYARIAAKVFDRITCVRSRSASAKIFAEASENLGESPHVPLSDGTNAVIDALRPWLADTEDE